MLNFDLYAIETHYENDSEIKEYFTSFEDAVKNRFKYANFYRPNGCVNIIKFEANKRHRVTEDWRIDMNSKYTKQVVVEYHNWNKNIHKEDYETGLDEWPIV